MALICSESLYSETHEFKSFKLTAKFYNRTGDSSSGPSDPNQDQTIPDTQNRLPTVGRLPAQNTLPSQGAIPSQDRLPTLDRLPTQESIPRQIEPESQGKPTAYTEFLTSGTTTIPNENPIFGAIIDQLTPTYQYIGETQSATILNYNQGYDLGEENFSGFNWQKPMVNFYIGVDRQLEPDLFDDTRWIVKDKFVLSLNAFTYLSSLRDQELIDISSEQLTAFAGMEFVRTYHYIHFANSFKEGLTKEYNKLFLGFLNFQGKAFRSIAPNEFLTKEDFISTNAGGIVHSPTTPVVGGIGASITAGALVEYNKISKVTLQGIRRDEQIFDGEKLRISYEVNKQKTVGLQAQLQLDFFNILKLDIMTADLQYSYKDSDKLYLAFSETDLSGLDENESLNRDITDLLKLKRPENLDNLNPFIVSREHRTSESYTSRYSVLIWGGESKANTEQIVIEKNGEQNVFFKHHSYNIKFIRSILSTVINTLLRNVFHVDVFKNYKSSRIRRILLEYKQDPIAIDNITTVIDDKSHLSFAITHEFHTNKTTGYWNKRYREYTQYFVDNYTSLPTTYNSLVGNESLRGPLSIKSITRINKDQLTYFSNLSLDNISKKFSQICRSKSRSKEKTCIKNLDKSYKDYKQSTSFNDDMNIWKLRDFIKSINKYTDSLDDIKILFGETTFTSGTFRSTTSSGGSHFTYFKNGTFNGLGVVDTFRRTNAVRAPASITH